MRVANTTSKKNKDQEENCACRNGDNLLGGRKKAHFPNESRSEKAVICAVMQGFILAFTLSLRLHFTYFLKLRTLRKMQSISCLFFILQNFDFIIRLPLHILTMEPGGNHCTCIDIISIISTLISFEKMHFSTY